MRRPSLWLGALLGAITSVPLIALLYLGEQLFGLPFFPFDLFDWLARVLPGDVIRAGISVMVALIARLNLGETSSAAKLLEQLQGIALTIGGAALFGALSALLLRRLSAERVGAIVGLLAFLVVWLIEASLGFRGVADMATLWLLLAFVGWAMLTTRWLDAEDAYPTAAGRRRWLLKAGGLSAAVALGAAGLGRALFVRREAVGARQPLAQPLATATPAPAGGEAAPRPTPENAVVGLEPVRGTRPELTDNDDFYRIDINTRPVEIAKEGWALEVAGLFDSPRTLTLDEIMAYPAVTQTITMGCISNMVGGDLIGTSHWTGVPLAPLLAEWGIRPEAQVLYIEAADGFYEYVVREDMMDPRTLLVYGMNGETLPVEHGFPLRIYIPNRYGMKQPKWITRIEAREEWGMGYWVGRGWSREARPQIVSVIDSIALDDAVDGVIPVGGIAWAGDRTIARVEVQDGNGPWEPAQLRHPPLSPLTWVIWRYEWKPEPGRHVLRVRAIDGDGTVQTGERAITYPDGATGYHEVRLTV